jgi:hypothetical protein
MMEQASQYKARPYFMEQFEHSINVSQLAPPQEYIAVRKDGAFQIASAKSVARGAYEGKSRMDCPASSL